MSDVARKSFVATLVAVAVIAGALAIWHLKVLVALLLLGVIIASAMRPGVDWLNARHVPRTLGVAIHFVGFACAIGLLLWLIVPRALDQTEKAVGTLPTSKADVAEAARHSHGIKHEILVGIQHRLERLPNGTDLIHPAVTYGRTALEVLVAIFFTFTIAAYWIFDKDRAQEALAGLAAIGAGLTVSWQTAAVAAGAVYGLRLLQDYVIGPKVLGHVTGVPPLIILITVTSVGLLFGGFYVLLSTPLAAVLATLVDVTVFDKDPAKEKVPALIFTERDAEAG